MKRASWRSFVAAIVTGGLIVLLGACNGRTAPEGGARAPLTIDGLIILRKGNGAEPESLDPHKSTSVTSGNILRDLFEGLASEAPDGTIIPGAAKRWTLNEEGTEYTFYLRPQARWSNGDAVLASDFVFSLRRSVDPATGSQYSQMLAPILNAEAILNGEKPVETLGVTALDAHTLKITLKAPTPYFLGLLTHSAAYPVHPATVEKYGDRFPRVGNLVTNGAYQLVDWVVQSHIEIARNSQYWANDKTRIDRVRYLPIEDASTELKRYRAGELDWTGTVPNKQFDWVKKHLGAELVISPYLGTYYYGFNLTKEPFKDNLPLRQALSLAINRGVITQQVSRFGEIPAYSWIPPLNNYTSQIPDYANWTQNEREAQAKKLYRQAGYSVDKPLSIEIRYNTSENHKSIAVAISQMWKVVLGVDTTLVNEEWKVFLANRKEKVVTQVFRAGWIGDYNDPYTFAELMHSTHGINDSAYVNPDYDELLAKASIERDGAKRRAFLEQAERLMIADTPIIPIYFYVNKRVVNPALKGWSSNVMDHHYSKNMYFE